MRAALLLLIAPLTLANAAEDAASAPDAPRKSTVMIPENIRAVLDAALASGNESDVAVVVKYARVADPLSGDAVQAIADTWKADRAAQRTAVIRQARFLDLWTGKAEIGGYRTTGNSDTQGVTAILDLSREGLRWRHKFHAQADSQRSLDVQTREHYVVAYEPNYKIDDRAYIYGAVQYESDRFLGYTDRFSLSSGAGYSVLKNPRTKLDLELGPGYRRTAFTDDTEQSALAARGSMNFSWRITNALSVTQIASAYVQRFNSTMTSNTALNAKLIGPLSAALSYDVQYESEPPVGSVSTDTTSRASLVYSF